MPDGGQLLYRYGQHTMVATLEIKRPVGASPQVRVMGRHPLFADESIIPTSVAGVQDVHPDGRRFAVIARAGDKPEPVVVVNWLTELRARTARP
jgi:hypothetical protein